MRTISSSSLIFISALVFSALTGCTTSVDSGTGGNGGGSSTTSTSTSSSSGTGGAQSTSTGGTVACGGKTGATCPATEYCDFPTNSCSVADETGVCKPRPDACPEIYSPTCGCDGKVYGNPCEASGAGVDINDNGTCPAPAGKFACGSTFCDTATSYCVRGTSDIGGEPNNYTCAPLPAGCGAPPACACLAQENCGFMCEAGGSGGLILTCAGG